jgi:hypothetical protein
VARAVNEGTNSSGVRLHPFLALLQVASREDTDPPSPISSDDPVIRAKETYCPDLTVGNLRGPERQAIG